MIWIQTVPPCVPLSRNRSANGTTRIRASTARKTLTDEEAMAVPLNLHHLLPQQAGE